MPSRDRKAARSRRATTTSLQPNPALSPAAPIGLPPAGGECEEGHDLAGCIAEIREQWRRRQNWHRAEKSLTLQAKALCRRLVGGDKAQAEKLYKAAIGNGDHVLASVALAAMFPLVEARDGIKRHRKPVEKRLVILAESLPVAAWVDGVRGFGLLGLVGIVGEAGDLSAYANPAKLWKRMGLAVMSDGKRQRKVKGVDGIDHGYSPRRRSLMWTIGASLVKTGGPYVALYRARKQFERDKAETAGLRVVPAAKIPAGQREHFMSLGHVDDRSRRYTEKRLLCDLWSAWRRS